MSEVRQRTERVLVRLLPSELTELRSIADRSERSVAEVLRASALGRQTVRPVDRVTYKARSRAHLFRDSADLLSQLSRVGNNLNQLTHLHHLGQAPAYPEIANLLSKIGHIADLVTRQITPEEGDDE